jgi:hypothetical protein
MLPAVKLHFPSKRQDFWQSVRVYGLEVAAVAKSARIARSSFTHSSNSCEAQFPSPLCCAALRMPPVCLQTDIKRIANCGGCGQLGNDCAAKAEAMGGNRRAVACTAGECRFGCKPGFADCDQSGDCEVRYGCMLCCT